MDQQGWAGAGTFFLGGGYETWASTNDSAGQYSEKFILSYSNPKPLMIWCFMETLIPSKSHKLPDQNQ